MALAYLTINLDGFTGDDHPPVSQYSTITLDPGADHIDAANDVIHVRSIVVSLDRQGKAATANGAPCVDGRVPVVAGVAYAVSAPNILRGGPHYIPALTAAQVVDLSDYITPGAPLTPDQAATLTARIVALEETPPGAGVTDHGALTGLGDDDHGLYALADGTRGAFAAPLGADDNYVTDAEKAALHAHSNKAALDLVSGTNTGDQVLPTWSTISGKPAVVAEGATQADARTAIGAGTSSFSGAYADLTGKPTAMTPTAHAATHAAAGSDPVTLTSGQISDLTETVQDIVGAFLVAGTNVTVTYNDAANTFTINATASGGSTDPEIVRDVIGAAMVAGSGVQITVNDAGDTITIASTAVLPTRQVIAGTGLTGGGDLSADRTLTVAYGTAAGTAAQGNDSRIVNAVQTTRTITAGTGLTGGGDLSANRTLTVAYGTTATTATVGNDSRVTGAAQKSANLSDLASASTARTNLGLGTAATTAATAYATAAQGATADAALAAAAAPELIRDTMATALVAGANVTITPNDGADTITIAASGGGGIVPPGPFTAPPNVGQYLPALAYGGHTGFALVGGRIYPCLQYAHDAVNVDAVGVTVDSGVSGATIELALYTWGGGITSTLVSTLGSVDASSAGLKVLTFTALSLSAGPHLVVARPSTDVTVWGVTDGTMVQDGGPDGGSNRFRFPHYAGASLPSSITWDYNAGVFGNSFPKIQLRRSA